MPKSTSKPQHPRAAKAKRYSVQNEEEYVAERSAEYSSRASSGTNAGSLNIVYSGNTAPSKSQSKKRNSSPFSVIMTPATKKPESQMTSIEKMDATRQGISKTALEELKNKAGFDYDQLSTVLGVARTTLINKKGHEKFPQLLSENIMSLADLYSFGYEVFGNQQEFNRWIFEPIPALGQQAPYTFLDSQYGREEVRNIIGRIAYGVHS